MSAIVRLPAPVADVEPGASVSLELTVRNTGTVVDQFSFEVLGGAAGWATFDPPTVSLFPEAEETVRVTFSPPRATDTASGAIPFGIRVESREDPEGSVVEEGTLNVAEFSEVVAEVTPHATRVWLRGRSQVAVDNRSNISYRAELSGSDTDSAFDYSFRPPLMDVAAGSVAFAKVTVRPKASYWRGPSTTEPYQVALRQPHTNGAEPGAELPAGAHPLEVDADGAILRDPLLPSWTGKAVAGLIALIALLALLWFALVKPQITAATQNAVAKQIKPVVSAVNSVASTVSSLAATSSPGSGTTPATSATTSPGHSSTTGPTTATTSATSSNGTSSAAAAGTPINYSLTATGNNTTVAFFIPKHKSLDVTDILLENSAGASGTVFLQDSGKVLMSWALANFRDLDYHWITPVYFRPNSKLQFVVKDCSGTCTPSLYFAGNMKSAS
jgi:hypothetical protein